MAGSYHPVKHLFVSYPYYYIYFNPIAGGANGSFGHYEWDYYFTGFQQAYEKLWMKISAEEYDREIRIASNFIIHWYFDTTRLNVKPVLVDYYQRSDVEWDYGIFCNTFIPPWPLKNGHWPPENTIGTVSLDSKPVSVVIERKQQYGLESAKALKAGDFEKAIEQGILALRAEPENEPVIINLARAYMAEGRYEKADLLLESLLRIYPDNEWAFDIQSEILMAHGQLDAARSLLLTNIDNNYKFYHSYLNLSEVYRRMAQPEEAAFWLKRCLGLNPFYKPAVLAMGNLLMEKGESAKAKRYFERANAL
jgi:hypothetical protein